MQEHRCSNKSCNTVMFNHLSIEKGLCRDCRGDVPNGSNYISKRVLIESEAELEKYGDRPTLGSEKQ